MTRPEPVRADTFDLQAKKASGDGAFQMGDEEHGFDTIVDEEEDVFDEDNEEDDDDALSSSPSIPDDDIDFNFMYALHSFAATVEGQANATKGDMLVLLDDSNSYWWLVRVVKDETLGYLPAETIETPQERLARLNKHRNIDLTAVMLEDHSPTSRSSSRKPFRRKGAKTVIFNNSCTYYQLESTSYDTSDGEEDEDDDDELEDLITDGQIEELDEESVELEIRAPEQKPNLVQRRDEVTEPDPFMDSDVDAPHPSPRIGIESDVSDHAGRKIMRIRDLNEQVGERPTSAIFRDSKLEPLKISVTPSIARDRISFSPEENLADVAPTSKSKSTDRENDRKRSLSVSSVANSDSGAESDGRENGKDKKGRKNSVFGNLFRKKSRKPSKDDETGREEETADAKAAAITVVAVEQESNEKDDSLRNDWDASTQSREVEKIQSAMTVGADGLDDDARLPIISAEKESEIQLETPPASPDVNIERQMSPDTSNQSSSIATPSLPWSDSSIHSFLDNDTSIRDALVLIYEGSRLKKSKGSESINPQIADLYGACAMHIDEMCSHLDDVLMSYMFDVKA